MTVALDELRSAVNEELGPAADLFAAGYIDRLINEGQKRYEPDVLRARIDAINIPSNTLTFELPSDFIRLNKFFRNANSADLEPFELHGNLMAFYERTTALFSGRIAYSASWPAITEDQECILPPVAADGLIAYALYRCYKRIASNRVDYRRYSTMVGNQASVADIDALSQSYLDEWADAGQSAIILPEPSS